MASTFPVSADVFKTIPTPTTTPTSLSDANNDTISTRLQQHSDAVSAVEIYLLSGGGWTNYAVDTGSTNNYIIALTNLASPFATGLTVFFSPAHSNTGASVININSLGNVAIKTPSGNPLIGGEIHLNQIIGILFDGTNFLILPPCPAILNTTSAVSIGLECSGCTSVSANVSFTAAGQNVTLSHVSPGVPVTVSIGNSSGGSASFALSITDPSGTNFVGVNGVLAGGVGLLTNLASAFLIPNGQVRVFTGVSRVGAISFT